MDFKPLGQTNVKIPVLGLGTWGMGGFSSRQVGGEPEAVRALQLGLELGMRFIDTAEMYARGHSEEVVAQAIQPNRKSIFLATKVSPDNFAHDNVLKSCESSLRRLETNYIDLYQLHWPNTRIPIQETMRAMERLYVDGKIRHIGVSNFSIQETSEAQEALSKAKIVSNQVEYSLMDRSIEGGLLEWSQKEHITIIAYSPIARGEIPRGGRGGKWKVLDSVAEKYGKTRTQVALNWLISQDEVVAIPKASSLEHVKENAGAAGWKMAREDFEAISEAFS